MTVSFRTYFRRTDLSHTDQLSIAHRGILSTISVAIQGVVRFVYSVLIGRLLGPAVLAATNSAISLAVFAALLWPSATASAATKFIARAQGAGDDQLAARTSTYLGRGALLSGAALAIPVGVYSYLVQAPGDILTALLVMALLIAWSGYTFVRGVYFSTGQVARATVWDALSALIAIGALACVAFLGWTSIVLLPLTIGYAGYAIAGWPRRGPRLRLPKDLSREMNEFIVWSAVGALAIGGFIQLSMLIATAVGSATDAGMYAAALSLATPAAMLGSVLALLLFPAMARATGRNDLAAVRFQADRATRGLVSTVSPLFGAIALLSGPLVEIVFGAAYRPAAGLLPILLCSSLLVTLNVASVNALTASTRRGIRVPTLISLCGMAVGLGLMVVLIPVMGVAGVATGYLGGTVIIGFGPIVVVWVRNRMPWTGLWLRFVAGVVAAVAIYLAGRAMSWGIAGDLAGTLVFLAVWFLLMRKDLTVIQAIRRRS